MRIFLAVLTLYLVLPIAARATDSTVETTAQLPLAKKLYERMVGAKISATRPELVMIAKFLAAGDRKAAAHYITGLPDFLNIQIRNFSLRLTNKDQSVNVPFNDFSALVAGIVRDDKDFREILTADYDYDISGVTLTDDERTKFFAQTRYTQVETAYVDLTKALTFKPKQLLVTQAIGTPQAQSERSDKIVSTAENNLSAGVFTTRTFAETNLSGGTNRRAVDFSLNQFLCVSMAEVADSNASDQFVGKDVERFPSGNNATYLNTCKSCHSIMDGMRGAFAKQEYQVFSNGTNLFYSNMNGDFFNQHKIGEDYDTYVRTVVTPNQAIIIPDAITNQENSIFFKTRYKFLTGRGLSDATARAQIQNSLNTLRDPAILAQLINSYRSKNSTLLASIRSTVNVKASRPPLDILYGTACNSMLIQAGVAAPLQEEKFLTCNLDTKKTTALIYQHYDDELSAAKTVDAEKNRLLGKLIYQSRNDMQRFVVPYLEALDKLKIFPLNNFDSATGVATKMNKGAYTYGFKVESDKFINYATLGTKENFFGWRGPNRSGGSGPKEFGKMISESRRFSQCMAKRVFENVCQRKIQDADYGMLVTFGDRFEGLNYNLKNLYEEISRDKACGIFKE